MKKKCKTSTFKSNKPIASQPTIKSAFQKQELWPPTNAQAIQLTNQIGKFIVGGFHPYSIVEEAEFKGLMKLTSPRYNIPSRTTFSRNVIPKMHEALSEKIKNELKSFNDLQSWSFTTDGWTSKKHDGYMSLTFHCLTDNFELKSYCLALKQVTVQHTGANVCKGIKDTIQEWEIESLIGGNKIPIYAVTDGAYNMRSAISQWKQWTHIDCFGHVLQLCVEDAIKATVPVSHLMAKCRTIVGHYTRSSVANARLRREQENLGQKPLALIQDVQTRWNSQYFMLERLVRCRNAINLELGTSNTQINTLKGNEWALAESVLKVFEPLVEATSFSSGETYPTISSILPMMFGIEKVLVDIDEKDGSTEFGEAVRRCLRTRFGPLESNPIYLVSTLVDPKYKLVGLNPELHLRAQTHLNKELRDNQQSTPSQIDTPSEETAPSNSRSIFRYLEEGPENSSQSSDDEIDIEVKMYLKSPKIKQNECSLSWWNKNKYIFPKIARVALKYLGIPATSVPSERLFSSAGNTITSRRRELLPQHAEQLVILHDNIKLVS